MARGGRRRRRRRRPGPSIRSRRARRGRPRARSARQRRRVAAGRRELSRRQKIVDDHETAPRQRLRVRNAERQRREGAGRRRLGVADGGAAVRPASMPAQPAGTASARHASQLGMRRSVWRQNRAIKAMRGALQRCSLEGCDGGTALQAAMWWLARLSCTSALDQSAAPSTRQMKISSSRSSGYHQTAPAACLQRHHHGL